MNTQAKVQPCREQLFTLVGSSKAVCEALQQIGQRIIGFLPKDLSGHLWHTSAINTADKLRKLDSLSEFTDEELGCLWRDQESNEQMKFLFDLYNPSAIDSSEPNGFLELNLVLLKMQTYFKESETQMDDVEFLGILGPEKVYQVYQQLDEMRSDLVPGTSNSLANLSNFDKTQLNILTKFIISNFPKNYNYIIPKTNKTGSIQKMDRIEMLKGALVSAPPTGSSDDLAQHFFNQDLKIILRKLTTQKREDGLEKKRRRFD